MSKRKLRKKLERALREERFPTLVSGCFTYARVRFHVSKAGLVYQDTDIPGYECEVCKLAKEKLAEHYKNIEMSFLYGYNQAGAKVRAT